MSAAPTAFQELMERVRAGCPEAARTLFERYGDHIRRVVRRKLHQRLRTQYDSLDFQQAVWASFFTGEPVHQLFATPEELVAFLTKMAYNKVVDAFRKRMQTTRYDLSRTVSLEEPAHAGPDAPTLAGTVAAPQPTPSQVAIANERWELLNQKLPPQQRRVLDLLRRGYTHAEIAAQAGLHPKVIQRLLRRLNEELNES
jgi:RNA polymerase sigma factor (sigma-70 family)